MAKPVSEKAYSDPPDVLQKGVFYHAVWRADFGSEQDIIMNIADPNSLVDIDKSNFKHGKTITLIESK